MTNFSLKHKMINYQHKVLAGRSWDNLTEIEIFAGWSGYDGGKLMFLGLFPILNRVHININRIEQ